ncbi:MAG: lipoyl(octanoyl) transferase LipB [Kiritimatiellia bacterium]|jgi:lipoyl(octanoyl) transferase
MNPSAERSPAPVRVRDLGQGVPFDEAFALQEEIAAARRAGACPDTLLLLEHAPVYTLGRSASPANVLWDAARRAEAGIQLAQATRGGDVTYHGPGQLVGYPILHLPQRGLGVLDYIANLEETVLRAVADFGVSAHRDGRNRGVWAGDCKLCALGIHVSHRVTRHGFALNVNTRLDDFRGIVACGLQGCGVTSLQRLLGRPVDMEAVKRAVLRHFADVFRCSLEPWEEPPQDA